MSRVSTNMNAQAYLAGKAAALPFDKDRAYLCVVATADTTITFANGVAFAIKAGSVWAPIPAPVNQLTIAGAGTLITG